MPPFSKPIICPFCYFVGEPSLVLVLHGAAHYFLTAAVPRAVAALLAAQVAPFAG